MRILLFASALSILSAACASVPPAPPQARKAFVIRHFEKETGSDPALTSTGQANAVRLANRLAGERLVAVYSTDTRRTRNTAAPSAAQSGLSTILYSPAQSDALFERLARHDGSVLIVGHSNTVPDIVARISGTPQPAMDESQYGTLFIIDLGTKAVTTERIGE